MKIHPFTLLIICCWASILNAADKTNILLICIDDLKPVLGCYGDPHAITPNLDRIASRGLVFDRAYCNQAICAPSRNSLMTGLRPQTIGIYDLVTTFRHGAPDAVTSGQYFKRQGFRTESIGKVFHVAHANLTDPDSWSNPAWYPQAMRYALPENMPKASKDRKALNRGAAFEDADVPDTQYGDGLIADEAVRRLQVAAQRPDEPFFLAVGFVRPHLPFVAPKKYWDLHHPDDFPLASFQHPPEGAPSYAPTSGNEVRIYGGIPKTHEFPAEVQRKLLHGYYAATTYTDAQVGKVLNELDRLNLAEKTIIVVWGDHGWHLGDHGMWSKHSNYEQATRIPLIVSGPGIASGNRTASLVETVDIYPTLAELAGLPPPEKLDGRSFAGVTRNPGAAARDHVIHVYPRTVPEKGEILGRAIRTDRYRFVEWKKPGDATSTAEFELYDYELDPEERKNLAESQPEVVRQLAALLAQHPEARPQVKVRK